jgi:anti-sigma factor RsiW
MKNGVTCKQYREALVDLHAGVVADDLGAALERHRVACPACATEAVKDDRLRALLASLKEESPLPVTWAQVLGDRRRTTSRRAWRAVPAFASLAVLVALYLANPFHHNGTVPSPPQVSSPKVNVTSSTHSSFEDAHALISASDMSGDPNRSVILLYGAPARKGG